MATGKKGRTVSEGLREKIWIFIELSVYFSLRASIYLTRLTAWDFLFLLAAVAEVDLDERPLFAF